MKHIYVINGVGDSGIVMHSAYTTKRLAEKSLNNLPDKSPSDFWSGWSINSVKLNPKKEKLNET